MSAATAYVNTATLNVQSETGVRFAYRRLGAPAARPLLLLQHFRGNMENWDPALIDLLATEREVIVFDNVGVGGTTGLTPHSVEEMANGVLDFASALELHDVDLLGFSIGSFVAQEVTLARPDLVGRLILASSAPQGALDMHGWVKDIIDAVGSPHTTGSNLLSAFFKDTPTSQAAGRAYLERFSARTRDQDPATGWQTRQAHYDAVVRWGIPNIASLERVTAIKQPVFVANGDDDRMILPRYSHLLAGLIATATVKIYPDSAHGFLFQHHEEFAADVNDFLRS